VVVADDSAVVRRTIARLLEASGFSVDPVASGEAAFDLCLQHPCSLVITDQNMPGVSGTQLCRLLRSEPMTADIPIVLLTADDGPRARFRARNAGADAYVAKPEARSKLVEVAERLALPIDRTRPAIDLKRSRPKPLERLGEVLETVLFRAQLGAEVRSLVEHVGDRQLFGRAVLDLVSQVARYDYSSLRLDGPVATTWVVDARAPWTLTREALATLGLTGADPSDVTLRSSVTEGPVRQTDVARFPVQAAGETLGELAIHSASASLGTTERDTVAAVAEELGVVVKSLFLLEETHRLSRTDGLTGLPNRRAAAERLEHELERSGRDGTSLSIALCDIDQFKAVNDTHGHNAGDAVLAAVAASFYRGIRRVDLMGRWGGEEFLVILPGAAAEGGRLVAERLRLRAAELGPFDDGPPSVTLSFGVATWDGEEDAVAFVDRADEALYRAKAAGRNRVELA
jgi:two-component system cell cycle response regulator